MAPASAKPPEIKLAICLVVVALASTLPFFLAANGRMPEAHDLYIHSARMIKFDDALRSGVWYPRWLGGMNHDFGAATTLFYPPLFYYLTSAAHGVLGDWSWAIAAIVVLSAGLSAVACFVCARKLMGPSASFAATLYYLLFPYRLIDLYHRGAFPELIGLALMPLALGSLITLVRKRSLLALIGSALALALLIITHPPSAYLFALTSGLYFGSLSWLGRSWRPLLSLGGAWFVGGGLSSFYIIPAIGELRYCRQHVTDSFPYADAFVDSLLAGSRFQVMMGVAVLVAAATFVIYAATAFRHIKAGVAGVTKELRDQSIAWAVVGTFSVLMMTPVARTLVAVMPGFEAIAFPWRWLGVLGLATSVMGGIVFENMRPLFDSGARLRAAGLTRILVLAAAVVTAGGFVFGAFSAGLASNLRKPFVPSTVFVEEDFTPRDSIAVAELSIGRDVEMMSGNPRSSARLVEWKPEERTIEATSNAPDTLHVYSFMFPGWTASIDGRRVDARTNPDMGTILVDVPQGMHTIKLTFENTRIRVLAGRVSAVILLVVVAGSVREWFVRRKRAA
jgi:hypothetical protein